MTTDDVAVTHVLNQLWHRWKPTVGGTSAFCDAVIDLYQLGREHAFLVNAYAYKDMKDKLVEYIVRHGEIAR